MARCIYLAEKECGKIVGQTQASVAGEIPNQKTSRLAKLGIGICVCGAVSRPLQAMIRTNGIAVIP